MGISSLGMLNYFDKVDAERLRIEELKNRREDFILQLGLAGGGGSASSTKKSEGAAEKALKMQTRLSSSDIKDEDTLSWYNNLFEDPMATAEVYDFVEDQAKNYDRNINLRDLPTLISIIQAPTSVEDKIDLFREFEIVDLTNKEEFYNLAKRVKNMTAQSGRTVFIDIDPQTIQKTDYAAREQQYQSVIRNVVRTARAGLENDPDKVNAQNALNNLKSSDSGTRADAEAYLLSRFITPEFITSLEEENPSFYRGLSKHPNIREYIKSSMPTSDIVPPSPTNTTRVVTQEMANKDRRLRPYVGQEIQFELKEDGQYYPILGD